MDDTRQAARREGPTLLDAALAYAARGWSLIPINVATKKPPDGLRWKRYQTTPADKKRLRQWFSGKYRAMAVLCGEISGGLVCRDFDRMDAYEAWATAHPDLARTLPTVATGRPGRHVYFRTAELCFVDLPDGEYRGNSGHYCVVPPSEHPTGPAYRWLTALPDGELPFVEDVRAAGLLLDGPCNREYGENPDNRGALKTPEKTEAVDAGGPVSEYRLPEDGDTDARLRRLVLDNLPAGPGHRNRQVFELARALKAVAWLADAKGKDLDRLEPYVRLWHNEGVRRGLIGTEPFDETRINFLQAWPKIRFPKGEEPMTAIFQRATRSALPSVANRYDEDGVRLLVGLCRELQRAAGRSPFFLGTRTAGRLLGVNHVQAWRWLWLLTHDGILEVVEAGDHAKRRATRYRYLAVEGKP